MFQKVKSAERLCILEDSMTVRKWGRENVNKLEEFLTFFQIVLL